MFEPKFMWGPPWFLYKSYCRSKGSGKGTGRSVGCCCTQRAPSAPIVDLSMAWTLEQAAIILVTKETAVAESCCCGLVDSIHKCLTEWKQNSKYGVAGFKRIKLCGIHTEFWLCLTPYISSNFALLRHTLPEHNSRIYHDGMLCLGGSMAVCTWDVNMECAKTIICMKHAKFAWIIHTHKGLCCVFVTQLSEKVF